MPAHAQIEAMLLAAGGALFIYNGTDIYIKQSTFSNNMATNGGAIYLEVWPSLHMPLGLPLIFCLPCTFSAHN